MLDILGNAVSYGDMVVAKGTGRYSRGLRVGMALEKAIMFESGFPSSYSEVFKIEHPSESVLKVKESILETIEKQKAIAKARKAIPKLKKKDLIPGHKYKQPDGYSMIYLGIVKYKEGRDTIAEGYGYLSDFYAGSFNDRTKNKSWVQHVVVRKTPRPMIEDLGEVLTIVPETIGYEDRWGHKTEVTLGV